VNVNTSRIVDIPFVLPSDKSVRPFVHIDFNAPSGVSGFAETTLTVLDQPGQSESARVGWGAFGLNSSEVEMPFRSLPAGSYTLRLRVLNGGPNATFTYSARVVLLTLD